MVIQYATLCSGIGCAEMAADMLGWKCVFQSEIDTSAAVILKIRFPETPNLGDMLGVAVRIRSGVLDNRLPDVLVAGTPCQSFSIAGKGESLDDPRGRLTLALVDVLDAIDERKKAKGAEPCVLVWENVPNVLSKDDNPFGCLVAAMVGADRPVTAFGKRGRWSRAGMVAGPKRWCCWRILDAQWFGVAQRRRRMFAVFGAGNRFDPSQVLFEPEVPAGYPAPRRETWKNTAGTLTNRARGGGGLGTDFDLDGGLVPVADPTYSLKANNNEIWKADGADNLVISYALGPHVATDSRKGSANGLDVSEELTYALRANRIQQVAFGGNNTSGPIDVATARSAHAGPHGRLDFETETFLVQTVNGGDLSHAIGTANNGKMSSEDGTGRGVPIVAFNSRQDCISSETLFDALSSSSPQFAAIARPKYGVRRLTPVECERLQGLPDGYTAVLKSGNGKRIDDDTAVYLARYFPHATRTELERIVADGPRYKAIGNGMAVPVVRWILQRLEKHMMEIAA